MSFTDPLFPSAAAFPDPSDDSASREYEARIRAEHRMDIRLECLRVAVDLAKVPGIIVDRPIVELAKDFASFVLGSDE